MKSSLLLSVLVIACSQPARSTPTAPQAPEGTGVLPDLPNAANLHLRCDIKAGTQRTGCEPLPYDVDVPGNQVKSCYRNPSNTFIMDLASSGQPKDNIHLEIANFTGAGDYELNSTNPSEARMIKIADETKVVQCNGSEKIEMKGAQSPGSDRYCTSSGCRAQLAATDPATPDRFNITVTCEDLCESGASLYCKPRGGGEIRFSVTADCPVRAN